MSDRVPGRRFRRLRYWWPVIVLVLASFPAYHAVSIWSAGHRLDSQIAALKSAGEPITLSDLQHGVVDPSLNGYPLLRQAIPIVGRKTPTSNAIDALDSPFQLPLTEHERGLLAAYCTERADAFPLLDAANRKSQCDAQLKFTSPLLVMLLPDLSTLRDLTMALRWQALVHASEGRHDRAIGTITQIDAVAKGAMSHESLVGFLVAVGCHSVKDRFVMTLVPDLKIGRQAGAASPDQVRATIASLLDQARWDQDLHRAMQYERVAALDAMQAIDEGRFGMTGSTKGGAKPSQSNLLSRWLRRPMIRANASTGIELTNELLPMLKAADAPTYAAEYAPLDAKANRLAGNTSSAFGVMSFRSLNRSVIVTYRHKAEQNVVAAALAVRWYEIEHGTLPATLQDLVPAYLPHVPVDTLAAGAPPVRYDPARGIVWSVGDDGTDDNGTAETLDADWSVKPVDLVVSLRRRPRTGTPVEVPE